MSPYSTLEVGGALGSEMGVNRGSKTSPYSTLELCGAWGLGWGRTMQTRRTTT